MLRRLLAPVAAMLLGVGLLVGAATPAGAITVTSISPSSVAQGRTSVPVTLTGTAFANVPTLVTVSGTGVTVSDVQFVSATQLTGTMDVTAGATVSARDVTVTQLSLSSATCTSCLQVVAKPAVTNITPGGGSNTGSVGVTVTGTGFQPGAQLSLTRNGFADIVGTGESVNGGGTSLTATVNLTGQPPGLRFVVQITNPDQGTGTFGNGTTTGFIISGSSPTLTAVDPAVVGQGATALTLSLTGTNLARGAVITASPSTGLTFSATTWISLTEVEVDVTVAADAPTGARDVIITNTDTNSATKVGGLTITGQPVATSVDPNTVGQGALNRSLTITGTGFTADTTADFGPGITFDSVTFESGTELTVVIDVAADAALGARSLVVDNGDGGTSTLNNALTVNAAPTVSSVTPSSRGQGVSNAILTVAGTGFVDGAVVTFSGSGITVNDTTFNLLFGTLTVDVTIAGDAASGARDVTVINPDGGRGTKVAGFAVNGAPVVDSVSPSSRGQGAQNQVLTIAGSGFQSGATVGFSGTGVTVDSVTFNSSISLTVQVDVAIDATPGARTVTVTNPDQGVGTKASGFTVNVHPDATSADPATLGRGAVAEVEVIGSAFAATPTVSVSGTGVTVDGVTFGNANSILVDVSVAPGASLDDRNLVVTNPDGGVSTCSACLHIVAGPSVTSITPAAGASGGNVAITNLAGTGFAADAVVVLQRPGQADIPLTSVVVSGGGTKITGTFDLTGGGGPPVAPGTWDVRVTNPTDQGTAVLVGGFTVTGTAPAVTGADPDAGAQGTGHQVTLTGTNFASGATVSFGAGITVDDVTVDSSTQITVDITVTAGATPGPRDVTVTNSDTQAGTCTGCFTVVAAPTATSVAPSSVGRGATAKVLTVTGSGFQVGVSVSFGTGITVDQLLRDSATQLTATVTVTAGAPLGAHDVTVTNLDGGEGTGVGLLTVTAAPAVTSAAPESVGRGAVNRTVVLTGTGFAANPTVTVSGTGVTVSSAVTDSATQITLTVTVAADAALTARNVTVTNTDGGTGTGNGILTITAAPSVTSIAPTTAGQGAVDREITITGTGFVSGATVAIEGAGVTVTDVDFDSSTQLTILVTVDGAAATGARDVVVTNPDAGVGTGTDLLTITTKPAATSVSPSVVNQGASNRVLTVTGTGFVDGATVSLDHVGITVDSTTFGSATQLTVQLDVAASVPRGAYNLTVVNPDGGRSTLTPALAVIPPAGGFTALTPVRLLDTRSPGQGPCIAGGAGGTRNLTVTGVGGVPISAAVDSVALNVTITQPTAATFVTAFPAGTSRPLASSLNAVAGETRANQVLVKVGSNGQISLFNNAGCAHLIVDVVGWYASGTPTAAGGFVGLSPTRFLDTRTPADGPCLAPQETIAVFVTDFGGVPADAAAVAMNVTVAGSTAGGFLTVYPNGADQPTASSVNFVAGQIVPNSVLATVGDDGAVLIFNSAGCTHVVVDIVGYYTATGGTPAGGGTQGLTPARLLDTRVPAQGPCIGAASTRLLQVTGVGGVPVSGVDAVALNVTVAGSTAPGFLTVFPNGATRPNASSVNFVAGQVVPNAVLAKVGTGGKIAIYNHAGCTHVVVDVVGWVASTP